MLVNRKGESLETTGYQTQLHKSVEVGDGLVVNSRLMVARFLSEEPSDSYEFHAVLCPNCTRGSIGLFSNTAGKLISPWIGDREGKFEHQRVMTCPACRMKWPRYEVVDHSNGRFVLLSATDDSPIELRASL